MNPLILNTLRGLAVVLIGASLTYFADVSHLPFLNQTTASIIAALCLGLEGHFAAKNGGAFFGMVA